MKRNITAIAMLGAFVVLCASAFADPMEGCSTGRKGSYAMKGGFREENHKGQCPVTGKLMKKSGFILKHKTELALTDEQVKTIKELSLKAEKDAVQREADQKTFAIDLKSKLHEEKIDVEGTNALIDKNTAQTAAAMKANVEAYAKLKNVLTTEQHAKMKELWKHNEK